jgi:hypothetical protein
LGVQRVVAKWGLLRGVDRAIPTVARSGHAVFARDDMPEQAAYDVAKAVDEHRQSLKWFIRPYSYDSRSVWDNIDVPLHPGAKRYYAEKGYLPDSVPNVGCDGGDAGVPKGKVTASGCDMVAEPVARGAASPFAVALVLLLAARRRQPRQRETSRRT